MSTIFIKQYHNNKQNKMYQITNRKNFTKFGKLQDEFLRKYFESIGVNFNVNNNRNNIKIDDDSGVIKLGVYHKYNEFIPIGVKPMNSGYVGLSMFELIVIPVVGDKKLKEIPYLRVENVKPMEFFNNKK